MKLFKTYGFHIFILITIIDLIGIIAEIELIHLVVKPLLMPVLLLTLFAKSGNSSSKALVAAGLLFSFLGDVCLLFDKEFSFLFIIGLASFLITHILYILYFLKFSKNGALSKKLPAFFYFIILIYISFLLYTLFPFLGSLKIPVVLYALALGGMLITSMLVYHKLPKSIALNFVLGATLFVISDSLLAINKFYQAINFAGFLIMLTYCFAQFLIVKAAIANTRR